MTRRDIVIKDNAGKDQSNNIKEDTKENSEPVWTSLEKKRSKCGKENNGALFRRKE